MRIGIAHHLGWAIAVVASDDHEVIDRRRIELVNPDLPPAPIHHEGGAHELHRSGPVPSDDELAVLVATVRTSVRTMTSAALAALASAAPGPIASISVRGWPAEFPSDIAVLRRPPFESRADSVMYCELLAEEARRRGWAVHCFDAKRVEADAERILGARAQEVLHGPRDRLGPPWSKDHRVALAATVVASVS